MFDGDAGQSIPHYLITITNNGNRGGGVQRQSQGEECSVSVN
jgi:hypothetical protein